MDANREILRAELRRKLAKAREEFDQAIRDYDMACNVWNMAINDLKKSTTRYQKIVCKAWAEYEEANGFK